MIVLSGASMRGQYDRGDTNKSYDNMYNQQQPVSSTSQPFASAYGGSRGGGAVPTGVPPPDTTSYSTTGGSQPQRQQGGYPPVGGGLLPPPETTNRGLLPFPGEYDHLRGRQQQQQSRY